LRIKLRTVVEKVIENGGLIGVARAKVGDRR
jgi:hypothetical protein